MPNKFERDHLPIPTPGLALLEFNDGEAMMMEGSDAEQLFYLVSGKGRSTKLSASLGKVDKVVFVGMANPGNFYGIATLDKKRSTQIVSMHAHGKAEVISISKKALTKLMKNAEFSTEVALQISIRFEKLLERYSTHIVNNSEQRLALLLIALSKDGTIKVVATQGQLAEMVGTTRGRVNQFMQRFKKAGFVNDHESTLIVHPNHFGKKKNGNGKTNGNGQKNGNGNGH